MSRAKKIKQAETDGGSNPSGIEVESQEVPLEPVGEADDGSSSGGSEADRLAAEALIEVTVTTIGKAMVAMTKIEELDFDPDEVEQLKVLWTPLIPTMSPVMTAIFGTLMIVSSKFAIYMTLRKKQKNPVGEEKPRIIEQVENIVK